MLAVVESDDVPGKLKNVLVWKLAVIDLALLGIVVLLNCDAASWKHSISYHPKFAEYVNKKVNN